MKKLMVGQKIQFIADGNFIEKYMGMDFGSGQYLANQQGEIVKVLPQVDEDGTEFECEYDIQVNGAIWYDMMVDEKICSLV